MSSALLNATTRWLTIIATLSSITELSNGQPPSINGASNAVNGSNLNASNSTTPSPSSATLSPNSQSNTSSTGQPYYTVENPLNLVIGILATNASARYRQLMGFGQSMPAINIAMKRIRAEHLVDNINFSFVWYLGDGNTSIEVGQTIQLINWYNVDALIGPATTDAALYAAVTAGYYNLPIYTWGAVFNSWIANPYVYPTELALQVDTYNAGTAIRAICELYNWTNIAFIYSTDVEQQLCKNMQSEFQQVLNDAGGIPTIVYMQYMQTPSETLIKQSLEQVASRARIVVACFEDDEDRRNFLLYVDEMGMNNAEYVYIFVPLRAQGMYRQTNNGSYAYFWQDITPPYDGLDAAALRSARVSIVIDVQTIDSSMISSFNNEVVAGFGDPPFYCNGSCLGPDPSDHRASTYAAYLHDAMYLYALTINNTMQAGYIGSDMHTWLRNGSFIMTAIGGNVNFQGLTGWVHINPNGARTPIFLVTTLNTTDDPTVVLNISMNIVTDFEGQGTRTPYYNITKEYADEATSIWANRNGTRPLDTPICGYTGKQCPIDITIYVVIGSAVILLMVSIAAAAVLFAIRSRTQERQRLNNEILIPYLELRKIDIGGGGSKTNLDNRSRATSVGGSSTTTGFSVDTVPASRSSKTDAGKYDETEAHVFYNYVNEVVFARKFPIRPRLTNEHLSQIRKLAQFDHDNVNKVLGICLDAPQLMAVWKYCHRGSLDNVIAKENQLIKDPFVMFALMIDITSGLSAMHNSFLGPHGALTSRCCLVNDRWQLKISDHGLDMITDMQSMERKKLLWKAPELIRSGDRRGTHEGDVYAFAIICSELLTSGSAWGSVACDDIGIDEVIYRVKRGTQPVYRPPLPDSTTEMGINPNLLRLIGECWAENPEDRPKIYLVGQMLRGMVKNGKQNLMDYVFGMLEVYANSLEQEVQARTIELVEEKRKSDILLYRMLPRQVADKLKIGESVEPEAYEQATIFFDDVVGFTVLAAKCSPLQVVNLLNELYSTFDRIIDMHDAYKVETIGDAYLIVSGVPRRNGDAHAREIAELSLEFLRTLPTFRIPHLPNEKINIRVGIHTGPVVAGVVGLTMPRYCLFGDTVNTASRMESHGKPGMVHISPSTNHYLNNVIGGYVTEPRGEIVVKGKGVMETYWLIGKGDPFRQAARPTIANTSLAELLPTDTKDSFSRQGTLKAQDTCETTATNESTESILSSD